MSIQSFVSVFIQLDQKQQKTSQNLDIFAVLSKNLQFVPKTLKFLHFFQNLKFFPKTLKFWQFSPKT